MMGLGGAQYSEEAKVDAEVSREKELVPTRRPHQHQQRVARRRVVQARAELAWAERAWAERAVQQERARAVKRAEHEAQKEEARETRRAEKRAQQERACAEKALLVRMGGGGGGEGGGGDGRGGGRGRWQGLARGVALALAWPWPGKQRCCYMVGSAARIVFACCPPPPPSPDCPISPPPLPQHAVTDSALAVAPLSLPLTGQCHTNHNVSEFDGSNRTCRLAWLLHLHQREKWTVDIRYILM